MSSIRWPVLIILVALIGILLFSLANTYKPSEKNQTTNLQNVHGSNVKNPYVKEFSLPNGTWPNGILVDKHGVVWIVGSKIDSLFKFDPTLGKIESYPIEESHSQGNKTGTSFMAWTILQDDDGFIWFSQLGSKSIWKFDPTDNKFSAYNSVSTAPFQMKTDNSGDIWFTTLGGNTIGVVQKLQNKNDQYQITEFNVGNNTKPAGLFLTNDTVWVTDIANQKVIKYQILYKANGKIDIKKITEIPSNNKISLGSPTDLFVRDDAIWLTEHGTSFLTRYELNSQILSRFPTSQNVYHVTTLPFWMRELDDGSGIWFNEHEGNKIAFFDTLNKTLTEYEIPSRPIDGYLVYPLNIAKDPTNSNNLWFSEWNTDKVGFVNKTVPIPFTIHSDLNKIILTNEIKSQLVHIEISHTDAILENNFINLNASSSMEPTAGLVNMTATFSADVIDLTKNNQAQLLIQNKSSPPGNYTLGISASDGQVTKTIFINLEIKK